MQKDKPVGALKGSDALSWQKKIFLEGFSGIMPAVPASFAALEKKAKTVMSSRAYAYVGGGAGGENTMDGNRAAFGQWKIVPRMLRDVSERDTSISLFGRNLPFPVLLSPVGVLELAHPGADLEVAKAAASLEIPFIFSNQASVPMEKCAAVMSAAPRWFQLYWSKSDELVKSLVQRAEACGCEAIVVTLDTTMLGWRPRDIDLAYLPFLQGMGIAQYTSDPVFLRLLKEAISPPEKTKQRITFKTITGLVQMVRRYPGKGFFFKLRSGMPMAAVRQFTGIYSNPALTWDKFSLLKKMTGLPVLLKGILHPDDAGMALDTGIDGIIVSNHGGRQVDGAVSPLAVLPAIAERIKGRIPILADSGIRTGSDIYKALALGADAVCIGRPYVYGLAIAGARGVREVLQHLTADFELTMGLSGCRSVREIKLESLRRGD